MNHSIYLGSLLCSAIFLNKKEAGTFLCYISMKKKAMQGHLLQKTCGFIYSDKKNP